MEFKILTSFLLSLVFGFLTIPLVMKFCKERKLYDIPDFRKRHKQAIPRLGGISFLPCMLLSFGLVLVIFSIKYDTYVSVHVWYLYLLFGFLIIYIIGIFDDIIGLSARFKFFIQFLAACCLPVAGIYINNMFGLFGVDAIPDYVGIPLTVFLMLVIINALNLIDGIDGLSSSLSLIALCVYLFVYSDFNAWVICVICAGLAGSLVAFFYYNMFGKPDKGTKIFMGDSGSLTLGYMISALFVRYLMLYAEIGDSDYSGVILIYSALIIPVFDVVRVVLFRLRKRQPVFGADRNHIHHRLMDAGLNQQKALLVIIAMAVSFIIINALLYRVTGNTTLIVVVDIALYTLLNVGVRRKGINKKF